ncbi:putative transcriptional regulator [Frankia torreyi]|uniref:Putative transcriptional regulator n=1 Tax=Frankia torreyi TaxID=1856 RepID=A0A0D8BCZ8_9ACTN|nr:MULTISPECIES: MerR family transcriptional regulator [Frankia]KJE21252.1 putative transcriptional regulator [Frankia torreyi]KQC36186.1 MerR family transcriptional regulator [Frankia sp. ACN1ag]KQM03215.1 putative transcriptional regulator [Frankia sp. CpI1-P]
MRIGELARRTAVSERLLRYYEEQGLLRPARLPSGYRVYAESDVDQVRRIRTLLSAGLPTTLIAQVLPCVREDGGRLVPCAGLVADLSRERARIDARIDDLAASRRVLDAVITAGETEPYDIAPPRDRPADRRANPTR